MNKILKFTVIPGQYYICRLDNNANIPEWQSNAEFMSVTKTREEVSIVVNADTETEIPGVRDKNLYKCLKIIGPLDLNEKGILKTIVDAINNISVSIFVISTYDTDYFLVRSSQTSMVIDTLISNGLNHVLT